MSHLGILLSPLDLPTPKSACFEWQPNQQTTEKVIQKAVACSLPLGPLMIPLSYKSPWLMILPPAKGRRPPLGDTSWDFGLIASLTWLPYIPFEK